MLGNFWNRRTKRMYVTKRVYVWRAFYGIIPVPPDHPPNEASETGIQPQSASETGAEFANNAAGSAAVDTGAFASGKECV